MRVTVIGHATTSAIREGSTERIIGSVVNDGVTINNTRKEPDANGELISRVTLGPVRKKGDNLAVTLTILGVNEKASNTLIVTS
jgi:hypothetical protein